jgi:hypothetical protein
VVFFLGIIMVALGAAGVLAYKPTLPGPGKTTRSETAFGGTASGTDAATSARVVAESTERLAQVSPAPRGALQSLGTMLAIAATALCWGSYGPTLHKGQVRMEGSRLRPFICVGVAYFFIAILVPAFILASSNDAGGWTRSGCLWSILAGALGALGALGVILAFNSGGSPVLVMPIVFGGAPVVNTFVTSGWNYLRVGQVGEIQNRFLLSLGLVIAGAVTVLIFAPRAKHATPAMMPEAPVPKTA